jgi:hypothetical protein
MGTEGKKEKTETDSGNEMGERPEIFQIHERLKLAKDEGRTLEVEMALCDLHIAMAM